MEQKRTRGLPRYQGSVRLYGFLFVLTLFEATAIIAQAFFLARTIVFLFNDTPLAGLGTEIGLFALAFMLRHVSAHVQRALAERYAKLTAQRLRERLMKAYFNNSSSMLRKKGTGHLATLMMDGVDQIKKYVEIIGIRMIHSMIIPAVIVVYVWTVDRSSAVILMVTVPIIIMFMILLGKIAQDRADRQYETYKRLSNHFVDSLRGLETLAFLGKSKDHARQINHVNNDYRKMTMRTLRTAFLSSFALDFFTSLSIAFVAVGLGLRLIDGNIGLLPALTILVLVPEYFAPIKQVGKDYHATLDGQVAMTEVDDILHVDGENGASTIRSVFSTASMKMEKRHLQLALEDVSVDMDGEAVLRDISLPIARGWTGIIGPSGSGKTSLIHVLAGQLLPTSGFIRWEEDVFSSLDHPAWYEQIAYIPQDPYIFPQTLADNCRFYAPGTSDADVRQVITDIGMKEFVDQLPGGIYEPIGEGGRALSGGQAQRVAIARALLSDKPVILLDEPTAHLDIETEYDIKQVMRRVFRKKQVIFATHRLHWMSEMDDIVLLDGGKVSERGTYEQMKRKQVFHQSPVNRRKEDYV